MSFRFYMLVTVQPTDINPLAEIKERLESNKNFTYWDMSINSETQMLDITRPDDPDLLYDSVKYVSHEYPLLTFTIEGHYSGCYYHDGTTTIKDGVVIDQRDVYAYAEGDSVEYHTGPDGVEKKKITCIMVSDGEFLSQEGNFSLDDYIEENNLPSPPTKIIFDVISSDKHALDWLKMKIEKKAFQEGKTVTFDEFGDSLTMTGEWIPDFELQIIDLRKIFPRADIHWDAWYNWNG